MVAKEVIAVARRRYLAKRMMVTVIMMASVKVILSVERTIALGEMEMIAAKN